MPNSSFDKDVLPHFSSVSAKEVPNTIQDILDINRHTLDRILKQSSVYTWQNLIHPLESMHDELHKTWSPIAHLHAVMETDELREAYNIVQPKLTEYFTEYSQNQDLYNALVALTESAEYKQYTKAQKKLLENDIRDFKLSGVNLPPEQKSKLANLHQELSKLMTKFSENVLDATAGWIYHTKDLKELEDLPETALQLAIDNAKARNLEGYVLTLDAPSFMTARKFLKNRELRKKIYEAFVTRASDVGPNAFQWDNTKIIDDILKIRYEIAQIVGFKNYAQLSLATKMAKTPQDVLEFLNNLVDHSKATAQKEYEDIVALAKEDGIEKVESWDLNYYSEKLRIQKYDFSLEDLRPYFPIEKVMEGMFAIVKKIYGITLVEEEGIDVWHPDVKFYSLKDESGNLRGGLYIDLYARPHKREGAWMDDCMSRRRLANNDLQYPVAYLNCNFMPAVENKPALLLHDDVVTLFHEFGHCLHHLLTQVDIPSVAGINGVPWDAVEFPSQFMENFCYEEQPLSLIAAHYQTGEPIPKELFDKMLKAKHFQTASDMLRQLEFAIFDFRIHLEYDPNKKNQVQEILNDVRKSVNVYMPPDFNRFQNSFSHIFAGGYAAGYYSYKWAEVLSADAYSLFKENGILDPNTGKAFMKNILEVGGVRDPMDSFIAFRGRKPAIDALLEQAGITK